jgi:O-antigen/teichoic acid export membrane protein
MLLAAQSFYRLSGFVLVMVLARSLPAAEIGAFVFAMALAESFVSIANFGMNSVMSRQVAADNASAPYRFAAVLGLRGVTGFLYVAVVMAAAAFTSARWQLVLAATAIALIEDLYYSFGSLFLALRKAVFNVTVGMIVQTTFVAAFLIVMMTRPSLWALVAVNGFRAIALVAVSVWLTQSRLFKLTISWDSASIRLAIPFVMMAAVTALRDQVGAVMLGVLSDYDQVAHYNLVMRVSTASLAIPTAICAVLAPLLVADGLSSHNRRRIRIAVAATLGAALVLSLLVVTLSEPLAAILYGPLAPETAPLLRILWIVMPVSFLALFASLVLQALFREAHVLRTMALATLTSFAANLFLIPSYGARGAIIAQTLATGVQLAILAWDLLRLLSADRQPVV